MLIKIVAYRLTKDMICSSNKRHLKHFSFLQRMDSVCAELFRNMIALWFIIPSRQAEKWSLCSVGYYFRPGGRTQAALVLDGHFREKNACVPFAMWATCYIPPACPCSVVLNSVLSCQSVREEWEGCFFKVNCPQTDQNKRLHKDVGDMGQGLK